MSRWNRGPDRLRAAGPLALALGVAIVVLAAQMRERHRRVVREIAEETARVLDHDLSDLAVLVAALEGGDEVRGERFRVLVRGVLDREPALRAIAWAGPDEPGAAPDGVFRLPAGAGPPADAAGPPRFVVQAIEPRLPRTVVLLGRSIDEVYRGSHRPSASNDPADFGSCGRITLGGWGGPRELAVRRAVRIVVPPSAAAPGERVRPGNLRGHLLAVIDVAAIVERICRARGIASPAIDARVRPRRDDDPTACVVSPATATTSAVLPITRGSMLEARLATGFVPRGPELATAAAAGIASALLLASALRLLSRRRRAFEEVRRRLEVATAGVGIGIWEMDLVAGELHWDEAFRALHALPADASPSIERWSACIHPGDRDRVRADFEAALREAGEHRATYRVVDPAGAVRHVRSAGHAARDSRGAAVRVTGASWDVTEIEEARERAEAASRAKSAFLANMSHEIRTPMTAILGYADLLETDPRLRDDPRVLDDAIRSMRTNARHLLVLIDDILDMSKIEAGRMTVERIDVDPWRVVHEAVHLVRGPADARGVAISVRADGALPRTVRTDPVRLRQILVNLAGNAVKFTESGSVTVGLRAEAAAGRLHFEVIDTGIGMSREEVETLRAFEAFTQADTSTTRRFGGTGLGLRISRALARLLGGDLEIDAAPGTGTIARFHVETGDLDGVRWDEPAPTDGRLAPPAATPGPAEAADDADAAPPLAGRRILLAEDGEDNRRIVLHHLRRAGAATDVAVNGRLAVERIEAAAAAGEPFDLVLMDMQMPELDGYAATRRLRERGFDLPVVALTAHAMAGDREKCEAAGCSDYLTKPVDRGRLIETCRRWCVAPGTRAA